MTPPERSSRSGAVTVTVMATWVTAGEVITTDGAEAEGIITDGDTTTDELTLTICGAGRPVWRPVG
jgi:hypothetical protein